MGTDNQQYKEEKSALIKQALPRGTKLHSSLREYKVVEVLGAGGFGITYKVSSAIRVGNVTVISFFVIKEHFLKGCWRGEDKASVLHAPTMEADVKQSRKDFIEEARRLNKIGQETPNIVKVNEVFETNGTAYYVMEYLDGGDLQHHVCKFGPLPEDKALRHIITIAKAVALLHDNHLLHLDIKPDNIVLKTAPETGQEIPVLIDFGIAKHFDKNGKPTSHLVAKGASEGYAPMEQYSEINHFAPEIDVYALGATLYFLLTGKHPPKAFDIHSPSDILANLPSNISEQTKKGIGQAMQGSRFERTPQVEGFIKSFAQSHTLPVGYVLRSHRMLYLIIDIVKEDASGITYKAIPTDNLEGSHRSFDNGQGVSTTIRTNYLIYELFGKGMIRNADGTITSLSGDAPGKQPDEEYVAYDKQGKIEQECFHMNNTIYHVHRYPIRKPTFWEKCITLFFWLVKGQNKYILSFLAIIGLVALVIGLTTKGREDGMPQPPTNVIADTIPTPMQKTGDEKTQPASKNQVNDEKKQNENKEETSAKHNSANIPKTITPDKKTEIKKMEETDDQKYTKAVSSGNVSVLERLASKGYAKAYSKLAALYLKSGKYDRANTYAQKAYKANIGKQEAVKVIETLRLLGYYDDKELPDALK